MYEILSLFPGDNFLTPFIAKNKEEAIQKAQRNEKTWNAPSVAFSIDKNGLRTCIFGDYNVE